MSDKPIIFSGPMIRALLDGRKTMTRRVLKPKTRRNRVSDYRKTGRFCGVAEYLELPREKLRDPSCAVGDHLWVRESLKAHNLDFGGRLGFSEPLTNLDMSRRDVCAAYAADGEPCVVELGGFDLVWLWKRPSVPSIHMPRAFSRLTLTVTAVKVERLQEISADEAEAEGLWYCDDGPGAGFWFDGPEMTGVSGAGSVECFEALWNSLHGPDAWLANPFVTAISFTVEKRNVDA